MKQTAVDYLAEKYDYITWMRNRDEISAGIVFEWKKHFLEQAKEMEKQQVIDFANSFYDDCVMDEGSLQQSAEEYYNETFNIKDK